MEPFQSLLVVSASLVISSGGYLAWMKMDTMGKCVKCHKRTSKRRLWQYEDPEGLTTIPLFVYACHRHGGV